MLLHNATIDHEFTTNDTLHSLIFEIFINLIVPTNTQTKNTIKPQKKTREIMNLQKTKRKYK
jgi:hypothetical protein